VCDKFRTLDDIYVVYNNITDYPFLSYDNKIYVATEENIANALLKDMESKVSEIRIEKITDVAEYLKNLYLYNGVTGVVANTCDDAIDNNRVNITDIVIGVDKISTLNNKEIVNTYLHLTQLAQLGISNGIDKCMKDMQYAISKATFIVPVIGGDDISQISVPLMNLDNENTTAIAVYTDDSSFNAVAENRRYVKYLLTYDEIVTLFKSNIVINPQLLWLIVDSGVKAKITEMNRAS